MWYPPCFMQMPSLRTLSVSEFQVVLENLDIDQIVPILLDFELLSPQDHEKLVKKSGKPAVKIIINKAKEHAEGAELFQYALEETREHKGHRKILSVLFTAGSSNSQKKGNGGVQVAFPGMHPLLTDIVFIKCVFLPIYIIYLYPYERNY